MTMDSVNCNHSVGTRVIKEGIWIPQAGFGNPPVPTAPSASTNLGQGPQTSSLQREGGPAHLLPPPPPSWCRTASQGPRLPAQSRREGPAARRRPAASRPTTAAPPRGGRPGPRPSGTAEGEGDGHMTHAVGEVGREPHPRIRFQGRTPPPGVGLGVALSRRKLPGLGPFGTQN